MTRYIIALDQGTTSSRTIIFDEKGQIRAIDQKEFTQHYPQQGWVEHDPAEIWSTQYATIAGAMAKAGISAVQVACMGITNQRETTILWDRETGEPVYHAIVWQDRRTAEYSDQLIQEGHTELIRSKTGLLPDAYFSATKIRWILEHIPGVRQRAEQGKLAFGTVDCWLVWKLTRGKCHVTDVTNAARTMLFNIHTLQWDEELLSLLGIPASILPEVKDNTARFGETDTALTVKPVPITGMAGDQQAALFGQLCLEPGMVKNTYGTGCFIVANTGNTAVVSDNRLLTTLAWKIAGKPVYALEGSVFIGGAVVQWLRDGLHLVRSSSEIEALARSVEDNGGVYFVPALTGLGAPYWDAYARGTIVGLTRGTTSAHIARAALEAIAFSVNDVVEAMEKDMQQAISQLRVDGGAAANNLLMQIQADLLGKTVIRPEVKETTALGAAMLAGLGAGIWKDTDDLAGIWHEEARFAPGTEVKDPYASKKRWKEAVKRAAGWDKD